MINTTLRSIYSVYILPPLSWQAGCIISHFTEFALASRSICLIQILVLFPGFLGNICNWSSPQTSLSVLNGKAGPALCAAVSTAYTAGKDSLSESCWN